MGNQSGNNKSSLLDWLLSLLGGSKSASPSIPASTPPSIPSTPPSTLPATPPSTPSIPGTTSGVPTIPADNTSEAIRIVTSRVLLVIYDPIMDATSGAKLSQVMKWGRADDMANACIQDILETSGGNARYQIVQRIELNEFPVLSDGFRYNPTTYMAVMNKTAQPHKPDGANFQPILTSLNILPRIARHEIDEVWIFNFPYGGFPESIMGGAGAFWCNANPLPLTATCNRRFVVMGFSFERGIGEMLESFGHRAESMLSKVFNCQDFIPWAYKTGRYQTGRVPATLGANPNLFQQFASFDQIAPGKSGIGTIHYAPNSDQDYQWDSPRLVASNCYGWLTFPHFQSDVRQVAAPEWGGGEIRLHHKWWLTHLPKVAGRTNGVANNWWQYIVDPNLVIV